MSFFGSVFVVLTVVLAGCGKGSVDEGMTVFDQTNVPVTIVAAPNVMYITKDHRVVIKGRLELSDNKYYYIKDPVVINNMYGAYALSENSSGYYLTENTQYIIKTDGTVWEMHMEEPTPDNDFVFTQVEGLENCVKICVSALHTVALLKDGTVWAWGDNGDGQLGTGTKESSESPVKVKGLANIVDISVSGLSNTALASNGDLYYWGSKSSPNESDIVRTPKKINHEGTIKKLGASRLLMDNGEVLRLYDKKLSPLSDKYLLNPEAMDKIENKSTITPFGELLVLSEEGVVSEVTFRVPIPDYPPKESIITLQDLPKMIAIASGDYICVAIAEDGSIWLWGQDRSLDGDFFYQFSEWPKCIIDSETIQNEGIPFVSLK